MMDLIRFDGVEEPDMEGCRKISIRFPAFFLFYMFYIVFWVIFYKGFLMVLILIQSWNPVFQLKNSVALTRGGCAQGTSRRAVEVANGGSWETNIWTSSSHGNLPTSATGLIEGFLKHHDSSSHIWATLCGWYIQFSLGALGPSGFRNPRDISMGIPIVGGFLRIPNHQPPHTT